jgi:cell division septal protein FtsQ
MAPHLTQRQEWIRSRRQRRKGAKSARLRRQFLRYILLASLLWGGLFVFQTMQWTISKPETDIVIHGNIVTTDKQIRDKLTSFLDSPIYKIEPAAVEKRVAELQAVKYAFVRRYALPRPKIVVEVLEEFPWATFSTDPDGDPEAVISESGRLIPIKDFPTVQQPVLKIYGSKTCRFKASDVSQWAHWIAFIQAQTHQTIEYIDMRKPLDVVIQDGDLCLKLGAPDTTLTRRLGRLASVMSALEPLRGRLEYVDLGLDNNIPLKVASKKTNEKSSAVY